MGMDKSTIVDSSKQRIMKTISKLKEFVEVFNRMKSNFEMFFNQTIKNYIHCLVLLDITIKYSVEIE